MGGWYVVGGSASIPPRTRHARGYHVRRSLTGAAYASILSRPRSAGAGGCSLEPLPAESQQRTFREHSSTLQWHPSCLTSRQFGTDRSVQRAAEKIFIFTESCLPPRRLHYLHHDKATNLLKFPPLFQWTTIFTFVQRFDALSALTTLSTTPGNAECISLL